jgi:ribosomal protein S3
VHFLISLFKIFTVQNKEIIGVRIRFQGRLNRWRRTKHIVGFKGTIGYFSYINRIDYGRAQAITRKGALGIHI